MMLIEIVIGFLACNLLAQKGIQNWPSQVFAPYVDTMLYPALDIGSCYLNTGVKYYTLAFIVSDSAGNPSWGGQKPISTDHYLSYINSVRASGGDVIVSFGGATGTELAVSNTNVDTLVSKYQLVVEKYSLTYIDIDIEGGAIANSASLQRRSQALAKLKLKYPNLRISYTLPVLPSGLTAEGVNVLKSAVSAGLKLDLVNIMAMDYGSGAAPNGATGMGSYAISAAEATYKQILSVGLSSAKVGITPMIGVNDVSTEIFRLEDAKTLINYSIGKPWVGLLSYWSLNRDTNIDGPLYASSKIKQDKYGFAKLFKAFGETKPPNPYTPPTSQPAVVKVAKCGPAYGYASCSTGDCCSQYGWCGQTSLHCGNFCQPKYGRCG